MGTRARILVVLGTRPEAIKLAPLIRSLEDDPALEPIVVSTGQHREMLEQVLDFFGIVPDVDLQIMRDGQTLHDVTALVLAGTATAISTFGPDAVMVVGEWSANHASPAALGGKNTQSMHIQIETDIDAHCARASAAGAEVIQATETQFYGDRVYRCRDPEGHIWTVGQTVKAVSRDEAEAITGLKITGWT